MRNYCERMRLFLLGVAASFLVGCHGPQSALQPAGEGAEKIASLFWWMLAGGATIWLATISLGIYSARKHAQARGDRRIGALIIGGGAVVPTIVLCGLLVFSLPLLPELLAEAPAGALKIEVRGKMWWWRIRYPRPNGQTIELANEIRLPVGEPVEFQLTTDDVIHSFWIPSLGGKIDMMPGRTTRLRLDPTKTGVFRGACAEYCGASHALMNFDVVIMEQDEFEIWLNQQSEAASPPVEPKPQLGHRLFLQYGCQACHTVRGTEARGRVGPDLTHVGSRQSLAAGALANDEAGFARWISDPGAVKPGVKMPAFGMLPADEVQAIAVYLEGLK